MMECSGMCRNTAKSSSISSGIFYKRKCDLTFRGETGAWEWKIKSNPTLQKEETNSEQHVQSALNRA